MEDGDRTWTYKQYFVKLEIGTLAIRLYKRQIALSRIQIWVGVLFLKHLKWMSM